MGLTRSFNVCRNRSTLHLLDFLVWNFIGNFARSLQTQASFTIDGLERAKFSVNYFLDDLFRYSWVTRATCAFQTIDRNVLLSIT